LTWIAKRDSWNWKVFSAFSNRKSHLSTQNAQWGADLEQFIKTDENLNQIDSEVFRLLTGFSVRYSKPKWTFRSGFSLSSLKNRITGNQSASFKTHLWIPLVGADWNPNRSNTLFLKYSFDVIETKLLDWYTGWILTGYRNFTSGAGWINPYRAHNWIFGYTLGNWGDAFQLNTSLYYQREPRYLGMDTEISPQFVISQPREFLNHTNFALNVQADQYVKALSGNLKVRLEINQNQFTSVINTRGIPIRTQWMQFGPEWKTLFNGKVNFHGGYSWNFSSTLATRLSRLPSQRGFLDADLNLGSQWHVGFNTEMHRFGSEIGMNTYVFSDLSAALKTKSGRPVYRLNVNNIWNKKAIETRSLTNSGYTVSGIPLRPRTVLVSAEFKL
jgi:hypothetical protein